MIFALIFCAFGIYFSVTAMLIKSAITLCDIAMLAMWGFNLYAAVYMPAPWYVYAVIIAVGTISAFIIAASVGAPPSCPIVLWRKRD